MSDAVLVALLFVGVPLIAIAFVTWLLHYFVALMHRRQDLSDKLTRVRACARLLRSSVPQWGREHDFFPRSATYRCYLERAERGFQRGQRWCRATRSAI